MTPSTPAPSAVRSSAPRLWGSSTPSRARKNLCCRRLVGSQQVLDSQELALPNDRQDSLMGVGPGKPGELVPGLKRYANTGRPAELDQPLQPVVATLPGHADMVKLPRTGTDGLLDRVETVKNFHPSSLLSKWKNGCKALECF